MDLVSVVITTHKREPMVLERALKSVLAQTYENIEVFVVDDSPSDFPLRKAVKEMVESCGSDAVKYIAHEECRGACAARNTGLMETKGTYIAFLDDDDEWLPQKIEKQIAGFTSDKIALVYCNSKRKNDASGEIVERKTDQFSGKVFSKLIQNNFIGSTSFPLLRTQMLKAIGGFDIYMQSAQDYDVWLRLAEQYEVAYIEEALAVYHVHEGEQITRNFAKKVAGLERLNLKNMEYLRKNKEAFWIRHIKLAPMYAGNKQRWKAMCTWLLAVANAPYKVKENMKYLISTVQNMV